MLVDNGKKHEIQDDLESCYWVLLYISFHYFKHSHPKFDIGFFDEYEPPQEGKPASGGNKKQIFLMRNDIVKRNVTWDCKPLNLLIRELSVLFQMYHMHASMPPLGKSAAFLEHHALIGRVDVILESFDNALESNEWPELNDALEDQMPTKPKKELDKDRRNTIATTFATGNVGDASPLDAEDELGRVGEVPLSEPIPQTYSLAPVPPTEIASHDVPESSPQPPRYELRSRAKTKERERQQELQEGKMPDVAHRYSTRSRSKPTVAHGSGKTKVSVHPPKEAAPLRGRVRQKSTTSKRITRSETTRRK